MPDETRNLVHSASRGDSESLLALLERYLPELRAFVRINTGPHIRAKESCSDLVQSVCREVLEGIGSVEYRGEAPFRTWLFTTSLRKIQDRDRFYKSQKRDARREVAADLERQLVTGYGSLLTPTRAAMRAEDVEHLEAAFDAMPPDYRDVITYARLLGMNHTEIAERMDKSTGAVRVLLHRAMARLGVLLAGSSKS